MRADELLSENKELSHKKRTVSDLIGHIKNTIGESANYSVLLGAGCSVSSGIRPATALIEEWTKELYERFSGNKTDNFEDAKKYLESNHGGWYNSISPYSSLFEKKCDLPAQRRRFIEQEVSEKLPSIGYAYLADLTSASYFNTLFTTNFDDLLNEAFYLYGSVRPQVCAHDSSVKSISITSKRPKIIKLHGDYLFDDIKSTLKETESLEQNTKEKLIELSKEYGLIVVGYSGSDRSIMDVLDFLSKQDNYLKNGVYWCLRKNDMVGLSLKNLLWKEKVYPVLIDGFDEFFAEVHSTIIGRPLDLNSHNKENRLKQSLNYIMNDECNLQSNLIIKKEIEFIKKNENSNDISKLLGEISQGNDFDEQFTAHDMGNLMKVDSLIRKKNSSEAYKLCKENYDAISSGPDADIKSPPYLRKLIDIARFQDDEQLSLMWCKKLIDIDHKNLNYQLLKSTCFESVMDRYKFLKDILSDFKEYYEAHNAFSSACLALMESRPELIGKIESEAINSLEVSLRLEPSLGNPAWTMLFKAYESSLERCKNPDNKNSILEKRNELYEKSLACNRKSITTLELGLKLAKAKYNCDDYNKYIDMLHVEYSGASKKEQQEISLLIANALNSSDKFDDVIKYKKQCDAFYEKVIEDKKIRKNPKLLVSKAMYFLDIKRDCDGASTYLSEAIECSNAIDEMDGIITAASIIDATFLKRIDDLIESKKHNLKQKYYYSYKASIYDGMENSEKCIEYLDRAFAAGMKLSTYLVSKTYNLLKLNKHKDVLSLVREYIDYIDDPDFEAIFINYYFSAKIVDIDKFNKTKLLNLSAKSNSNEVKICAFILLGDENPAKRIIADEIEKQFSCFFRYKKWPIMRSELLPDFGAQKILLDKTA